MKLEVRILAKSLKLLIVGAFGVVLEPKSLPKSTQKSHHILRGVLGRRDGVNGVGSAAVAGPLKQALELQNVSDPCLARRWPCRRTGAADLWANAAAADPQIKRFHGKCRLALWTHDIVTCENSYILSETAVNSLMSHSHYVIRPQKQTTLLLKRFPLRVGGSGVSP